MDFPTHGSTANMPQFIQGTAYVISAQNECEDEDGETQAPCGREGLYTVAFRNYLHSDTKWHRPPDDDDQVLQMDCSS
ncbi:MAG: hypothetical protein ACPG75_03510, partial [Alloalcanivorax venustensis]